MPPYSDHCSEIIKRMSPEYREAEEGGFHSGIDVAIKMLERTLKELKQIKKENSMTTATSTTSPQGDFTNL